MTETVFATNYDSAQRIADQNNRYIAAEKDPTLRDYPDIQAAVVGGVRTEQRDTLAELAEIDTGPYDALALEMALLEDELAIAREQLAQMPEIDAQAEAALAEVVRRAIELSPRAENEVRGLAAERRNRLAENPSRMGLMQSIARTTARLDKVMNEFVFANRAWPQPIIPGHQLEVDDAAQIEPIDIFPTDPPNGEHGERGGDLHIETYGRQRHASERAADALVGHLGKGLSANELAPHIYDDIDDYTAKVQADGKDPQNYLRSRVHSIFTPNRSLVPDCLEGDGCMLQYGWRMWVDAKGKQVRRKARLYRAVKATDDDMPSTFVEVVAIGDDGSSMPEVSSAEVARKQDADMVVIEGLIGLLNDHGLLPDSLDDTVQVARLKVSLMQLKKDESQLFGLNGVLEDLYKVIVCSYNGTMAPLNIVAGAVGGKFGRRLPHRKVREYERLIEAALMQHYGVGECEDTE